MRVGVAIEETWDFFNEIYEEIGEHHEIGLFKRREVRPPFLQDRINRYLFRHDLQSLMQWSDVMFFEWASHLLAAATHMPKTCGIVTRLHRYELYQWVDRINWDAVDRIVMVSEAVREAFIERFPDQASKIVIIRSAVPLDKFQLKQRKFNGNVGILCHLTPRKRVYDLLLDFYELSQAGYDFHLHIAGGAHPNYRDYYYAMQDAVKKLNLQDDVTFYGNVLDTWNWYQNIDIFISNSYSEGLPAAPIEAMASGCFCLSHRWTGAEELLPQENLYYTGQELNQKILAYTELSSAEKLKKKEHMREIVCTNFDMGKTKVEIRQVIESLGV